MTIRRGASCFIKGSDVFTLHSIGDFAVLLEPRMRFISITFTIFMFHKWNESFYAFRKKA